MSYAITQVIIDYSMEGNKSEPVRNLRGDTKVSVLKQKIKDLKGAEGVRLAFCGEQLKDNKVLSDYRIKNNSVIVALLRLRGGTQTTQTDKSRNMDPEFVRTLCPDMQISKDFNCQANVVYAPMFKSCEQSEYYKAQMSCGHKWCGGCVYYYLDQSINNNGQYKIKCPNTDCQKPWTLNECFAAGNVQNQQERIKFNRICNKNGIIINKLGNWCPVESCSQFFYVDDNMKNRGDSQCPSCKYVFCQWCRLKWNNRNICKEKKCDGKAARVLQELITDNPTKTIGGVKNVPTKRLCQNPNCRTIYAHNSGCKRVVCLQCNHMQCHICNRRWIGRPCPNNGPCTCNYCKSLGEDAPAPCSYNITCTVKQI